MCTFCFPLHLGFCMVTRGGMFHVKQGVFGKSDSFFCKASGLGAGWCSLCLCHTQFLRPLAWWIGDLPLTLPCVRFFPLAWCGLQNTMRSLLACATPSSLLAPPLALACWPCCLSFFCLCAACPRHFCHSDASFLTVVFVGVTVCLIWCACKMLIYGLHARRNMCFTWNNVGIYRIWSLYWWNKSLSFLMPQPFYVFSKCAGARHLAW